MDVNFTVVLARKSIFSPKRNETEKVKKAVEHDVGEGMFGGSSRFK